MQVYSVPKSQVIFFIVFLGIVTLISLILFIGVVAEPEGQPLGRLVLGLNLAIISYCLYWWLKQSWEIRVAENGLMEFRSITVSTKIAADDIVSIKVVGKHLWFNSSIWVWTTIRHSRGKIGIYGPIPGLEEFLDQVKNLNPAIEIKIIGYFANN